MKHHLESVGETAEVMKGHFERVAKGVEFFNAALIGVGAVLAGGALFKESVGEAVKLVTETNRLASVFGITLEKASGLHETLHTLGIESDAAATMAMKLSRQVKAHEDALNADGIATRNAAGEQLNLLAIQSNVIDRLREMAPGLQRNKVAIDAFGRGAGDLTVLLRLNDEAMREGMETAKALGIVVTKDGVESTVAYQHSVAEAKSVIDALWVVVGQALIPVIKEVSDMLKYNGSSAVDSMRHAMEFLINVCREVVAVFATFDLAISVIAGALAALISVVGTLGKVLQDVFTLNWSAIGADFKAGVGNLVKIAHDAAAQISSDWSAMNMGWIGDAKSGKAGGKSGNEANPNTGDQAPDKAKKGTKEKGARADPSEMADLEEALVARKLALDKTNEADNTFREMSKAEEAKYWQDILARTDLSAKDRQAITRKYLDASLADKKTNFAAMIAMQQAEIVADKGNGDAKIAMAHKIEAEMIAAYGKESKEAAQAGAARIRVEQAVATERSKLATEDAKSHEALALEVLAAEEAAAKHRREMGQITAKELLRQEQVFLAAKRAIQLQAIQAQIAAAKLSPDSVEAIKKLNDAKLLLEQKYLTARAALIAKAESQSTARVRQGIAEVSSSWGQALAKMATLQASFSETIKSLWQGVTSMITNALAGVIEQYLTNWLTSLLIGKGAQATTGLSGVESNAAVAGAAAYASTAAIPIIGPGLAPEAAWTAYGGAMSFAGLASFATGAWNLPGDMVAQVHKGEMIVPRTFAEDFRANGGNASGVGGVGGGGSGGDTYHIHATDAESFVKMLHSNRGAVAKAVKGAVRDGVR